MKSIRLHSLTAQLENADVEEEEMDNFSSLASKLRLAAETRQTEREKNGELTASCSNNGVSLLRLLLKGRVYYIGSTVASG